MSAGRREEGNHPPPGGSAAGGPAAAALVLPLLAGAALRLWGLGRQVLGGDELHVVRAALDRPLGEILTTYQAPDTYLPLAALARLVLAAGGSLREEWLRLPGLLAGLAALWVVPRLAARHLGRPTGYVLSWLVALSPSLVLYSRIARSYMPLVLLTFAAAMAFLGWLRQAGRPRAAGYVAAAAGAVFLHPVALPIAVAPLLFGAAVALGRQRLPEGGKHLARRILPLAAALALALALFVVPARESLRRLAETRRQPAAYGWATARGLALLEAGASTPAVALGFWMLAGWGLASLARRRPGLAAYSAWLAAAQLGGVLALSPVGADLPLLLNRYTLPALPFILLWVAAGLEDLRRRVTARWGRRPAAGIVALLVAAWAAAGPLAGHGFWRGSFAHHNDFVDFSCPPPSPTEREVPASYRRLAADPRPGALIEAPWPTAWRFGRSLPAYQAVHGRRVLVATGEWALWDPRLALANVLPARPDAFLGSRARYLVVHLDLPAEERRLPAASCGRLTEQDLARPALDRLAREGAALAAALEGRWGPPDFADAAVRVWDLERARRR